MHPRKEDQAEILIETRDLETDRAERVIRLVDAPGSESEEREQLQRAVDSVDAEARLRTFANGAATFIAHRRLVIASFRERPARPATEGRATPIDPDEDDQEQLFAA